MRRIPSLIKTSPLLVAMLLLACSTAQKPAPEIAPKPKTDWVLEIRSRAASVLSVIEVLPLADRGIDDLRAKAKAAEAEARFGDAEIHLAAALVLSADDPELWQWRAEIALAQNRWHDAHTYASRSEAIGPKLGGLCVRNWLTLKAVAHEMDDASGKIAADAKADACPVPRSTRL